MDVFVDKIQKNYLYIKYSPLTAIVKEIWEDFQYKILKVLMKLNDYCDLYGFWKAGNFYIVIVCLLRYS